MRLLLLLLRRPLIADNLLTLSILISSFLLSQSSTTTSVPGSDVTPTEVNDRTHYQTGGEIVQPLRIAAVEEDSFFTRHLTPSGDSFQGYLVDVVREISRIVPYQFEWTVVKKEEGSGRKRKNGNSWTELTEKLLNEVVNVSVLPINSVSWNHTRRVSHTQPFLKSTISVVVRAPDTPSDHRPSQLENLLSDANHSRLGFGVASEALAYHLRTYNLSLYQQIWNDRTPSEIVVPLEEGLRQVRQGHFALIMESTEASLHASREPCDLLALDQFTYETSYVFATRRNATLVGRLDAALARLREGDFFGDLFRKWWDADECTVRRDETDRDDRDLDMERIFFTSPIKFFKSKIDTPHEVTRSASLIMEQFTRSFSPDAYRGSSERNATVSVTVSKRPYASEDSGHGRLNTVAEYSPETELRRGSDRTSRTDAPRPPTSVATTFEVRVQTDPEIHRKFQRRSRTRRPKHASTPTSTFTQPRVEIPPTSKLQRLDVDARGPVLRTVPASSMQSARWPANSLNNIPSSRHLGQKPSHTAATPTQSKTTKSSRDFAKDFDWFFVTHQPRFDEEMNYDDEQYDDDVYHEQRVTVRPVEAKQKDPVRATNWKDTGAKNDVKSNRNSSDKPSSRKTHFAIIALTAIVINKRFSCHAV